MKSNKLILLASMAVLLACNGNKNDKVEAATNQKVDTVVSQVVTLNAEQLKSANLSFGLAQAKAMHKILKVNGLIDVPPSNIVSISIPMGGYLKKTSLIPY
jgi:cobalt-zinc-cadmium efflux system membrane fusion protein